MENLVSELGLVKEVNRAIQHKILIVCSMMKETKEIDSIC